MPMASTASWIVPAAVACSASGGYGRGIVSSAIATAGPNRRCVRRRSLGAVGGIGVRTSLGVTTHALRNVNRDAKGARTCRLQVKAHGDNGTYSPSRDLQNPTRHGTALCLIISNPNCLGASCEQLVHRKCFFGKFFGKLHLL